MPQAPRRAELLDADATAYGPPEPPTALRAHGQDGYLGECIRGERTALRQAVSPNGAGPSSAVSLTVMRHSAGKVSTLLVLYLMPNRDGRAWIMVRSATDLSKADLHVFSKLFDDGLERGQEAKAFSWRQIGGHDDVLDFFVGHLINVEMTRQPAP